MDELVASRTWPRKQAAPPFCDDNSFGLPPQPALAEKLRFFAAFLRRPAAVGALAPSSAALGRAIVRGINLRNARLVVELGPGTGALTKFIVDRLGRHTRLLAFELDGKHARSLQQRFPRIEVIHDSAENLRRYVSGTNGDRADCIISGLPWGNMTSGIRMRILEAVFTVLRPGGTFTGFGYVHAAWFPSSRKFRRQIEDHFEHIATSPIIWRNLPPAFVFQCR